MMSYKIARRQFLRSAGASAVLLPLLKNIEARAQGMPAPLRFMILHHPLGTQHVGPASPTELWRPSATATTSTFTLPQNSAPFTPLKPKMVMIDGLNIVTASKAAGNSGGQNTHEGGVVALSTGVPTLGQLGTQDHAAGGPSIDQLFLDQSPVLGGMLSQSMTKTQFQYLALAADIRSDRDEVAPRVLSYRPPLANQSNISLARQPLFPETQPINVYNRIFGSVMSTGGNASAAAAKLAQQQSALDFVSADLARMRTLVPASETPKLDSFATAVQQLESSLRMSLQPPPSTSSCQKPTMPEMFGATGAGASGSLAPTGGSMLKGVDYYNPSNATDHPHQRVGLQQLAMIQAAFQCDYARVATFMWSPGTNWVVFPTSFQGATLPTSPPSASSPHHPPSHTTNSATMAWLAQLDLFYAQQSFAAIQAMDAVKDFDGNTLLDNTVVVYLSEIARAYDHDQLNIPVIVFGGKNTGIKGGQYLKIKDGPLPGVDSNTTGNRPFNDLWLTLAPLFGVNLPSLGARAQYTGPIPGLVA